MKIKNYKKSHHITVSMSYTEAKAYFEGLDDLLRAKMLKAAEDRDTDTIIAFANVLNMAIEARNGMQ